MRIKQIFKYILQAITWFLIMLVYVYRIAISPMLPRRCRYLPTCSNYMIESIKIHGVRGVLHGVRRILRCHPFGGHGHDPVKDPTKTL